MCAVAVISQTDLILSEKGGKSFAFSSSYGLILATISNSVRRAVCVMSGECHFV